MVAGWSLLDAMMPASTERGHVRIGASMDGPGWTTVRVRPAPSTDLVVDTGATVWTTWTRRGKERESARGREREEDDDDDDDDEWDDGGRVMNREGEIRCFLLLPSRRTRRGLSIRGRGAMMDRGGWILATGLPDGRHRTRRDRSRIARTQKTRR